MTEPHGLENKHPPVCKISVHPDEPPAVKIISPNEEMAARPDDEIEIEFSASDDFGIAKAELVIYSSKTPGGPVEEAQVIDIPLGEHQYDSTIAGSVPLDLEKLNLQDGQELQYAVRVYDTPVDSDNRPLHNACTRDAATARDVLRRTRCWR
ncbi:MAG: DUF4175 family protein [Planctomycetaceae bacterium]